MAVRTYTTLRLLRPHHWIKNLLVLAPPFFGGTLFTDPALMGRMAVAFVAFSLAASSGYMINDVVDVERDRIHPRNRLRPVAAGEVGARRAVAIALLLLAASLAAAAALGTRVAALVVSYLVLQLSYTFGLKHVPILGSFAIALGFVFRISVGGAASGVEISSWLYLTTFLLALLLAFGKRKHELALDDPGAFRGELAHYPSRYVDYATVMFSTTALVTYSLYTVERGPKAFILTVPLACYGVLRYLYIVHTGVTGDPTEALVTDRPLLAAVALWVVLTAAIIQFPDLFGFLL